jgi:hypothetical protein
MPEVLFPYQEIKPLVRTAEMRRRDVFEARSQQRKAEFEVERLEKSIERQQAVELDKALNDGLIDGSNAQERGIQIDAIEARIAQSMEVELILAEQEREEAQRAHEAAVAEIEAIEDEISLTRAWLYSLTRIR